MLDFLRQNYTLVVILSGTMLLGFAAGMLGVFSILRRQALAGDALSHAALPGIALAYLFTGNRSMVVLIIGAAIASLVAMLLIEVIKRYSKIKYDAALALILSAFFGFGQVLIQVAQNKGSSASAGLEKFIFGQAALMSINDVYIIGIISIIVSLVIGIFWKEIKVFVFNGDFAQSIGVSKTLMSIILNMLTVIVVVIGIRTVGVILMSALIIAPGVASRQWSHKLSVNTILAGLFGLVSGIVGTYISYQVNNLPTGPVIVAVLSTLIILSLLLAPKRGMLKQAIYNANHKKRIKKFSNLIHLYTQDEIETRRDIEPFLIEEGYIIQQDINAYILTEKGTEEVETLLGGKHYDV